MNHDPKNSSALEEAEPTVGYAPVPVVLFLILGALFFGAQLYLDKYGGGFHPKVYQPYDSWKMVNDLQPKDENALRIAKGRIKFTEAGCVACHQANGLGIAGQFPPLVGSEWVLASGPNRIIRIVQHGLEGPIKVKGVDWNGVAMPGGLGAALTDDDFANLLSFIRGNPEWGNSAAPVKPEQIKAVREQIKDRQTPWRAEELFATPEQ